MNSIFRFQSLSDELWMNLKHIDIELVYWKGPPKGMLSNTMLKKSSLLSTDDLNSYFAGFGSYSHELRLLPSGAIMMSFGVVENHYDEMMMEYDSLMMVHVKAIHLKTGIVLKTVDDMLSYFSKYHSQHGWQE